MGCFECTRLATLFADAINKHASLRQNDLAAIQAGDMITSERIRHELEHSTVGIKALRAQLLNHEASHNEHVPQPRYDGRSSEA